MAFDTSSNSNANNEWILGVFLAFLASVVGGGTRIIIRKSWLLTEQYEKGITNNNVDTTDFVNDKVDSHNWKSLVTLSNNKSLTQRWKLFQLLSKRLWLVGQIKGYQCLTCTLSIYDTALLLRGVSIFIMTFILPFIGLSAMYHASPSIVIPITGLMLVWIVLSSPIILGEYPTTNQIVASTLITSGNILVALFGDHSSDRETTIDELIDSYYQYPMILFHISWIVWMGLLLNSIFYTTANTNVDTKNVVAMAVSWFRIPPRLAWGFIGGSLRGLEQFNKDSLTILKVTLATMSDNNNEPVQTQRFLTNVLGIHMNFTTAAAAESSSGGGITTLLFQTMIQPMLDKALYMAEIMLSFPMEEFILIAGNILITILSSILLGACMKQYDALYSSAMFTAMNVVLSSVMSMIHYHTFDQLESISQKVLYPMGLMILLLGIALLAQEKSKIKAATTTTAAMNHKTAGSTNSTVGNNTHASSPCCTRQNDIENRSD